LVQLLGVTEPTIRKDLRVIESQRLLKRTHGGAICTLPSKESDAGLRRSLNEHAKAVIAGLAAGLIDEGDAIYLGSGTTVEALAGLLIDKTVTVLTPAVGVAEVLADRSQVDHVLLGGRFRRISASMVGPLTLDSLEQFTVNTAFIGVSGVAETGLTVADVNEAALARAVIGHARRVVVMADHSKVGAVDFARVCELDEVDVLITDCISSELSAMCSNNNVELIWAVTSE
jgi:DeoR/GlpR family transcriptional regulator of sugar metabolism